MITFLTFFIRMQDKQHKCSLEDLNPRLDADNSHTSVLTFEMTTIEPDDVEIPTRKLTWKPLGFFKSYRSSYYR
jgi:hypothetical protein